MWIAHNAVDSEFKPWILNLISPVFFLDVQRRHGPSMGDIARKLSGRRAKSEKIEIDREETDLVRHPMLQGPET